MIQSKAWSWETVTETIWQEPAEYVYYLAQRWRQLPRKNFLDLGCGIGRHALFFAEQGFSVQAFDLSEIGVAALKKAAQQKKLAIETQVGDMLSLPYASDSIDCLLAFHTIYHSDQAGLIKTLAEIHRIVVPNGEIFLTLLSKNKLAQLDFPGDLVGENTIMPRTGPEAGIPHHYVDEAELRQLLVNFEILKLMLVASIYDTRRNWHYYVLAKKPGGISGKE